MSIAVSRSAVFLALAISGSFAWAYDVEPIRVGFLEVKPTLDTNVTPVDSTWLLNGEEESEEFLLFKPRLAAFVTDGKNQFSSSLEILNGNYSARGVDSFVDTSFEGAARFALGRRNLIKLHGEFFNTHEKLDTAFKNGSSSLPERFTTSTISSSYEYATPQRNGRIVIDVGTFTKNYTNTNAVSYRSHEDYNWGSSFFLRVLPGTDMVMQYRFKNVDFLNDRDKLSASVWERDNRQSDKYLGATWEAPAAIPGKLKIASGFKAVTTIADYANANSARWETNLRWEPLRDSIFTVNADRTRREDTGMATITDTTSIRYNWEYSWSYRLKSAVVGNYSGNTYLRAHRKDEGLGLKLRMDYAYSNWLNMFVAVGHDQKRSVLDSFNFTQHTFMLGVSATLEQLWSW